MSAQLIEQIKWDGVARSTIKDAVMNKNWQWLSQYADPIADQMVMFDDHDTLMEQSQLPDGVSDNMIRQQVNIGGFGGLALIIQTTKHPDVQQAAFETITRMASVL